MARKALPCQQAFSKPCLVNMISKDAHLVFSMYKRKNYASKRLSHDSFILFLLQLNQTAGIFLALNSYHSQVYFKKTGR